MAIQTRLQRFGLFSAVRGYLYYAAHRWLGLRVVRGMVLTVESANPDYASLPNAFTGRRILNSDLHELADERLQISRDLVREAQSRSDWCFLVKGDKDIASYSWYSNKPVPINDGLVVHFFPEYLYMYKGYTAQEFRGVRLHAYGMMQGLRIADFEGYRGLIGYVDAHNCASLKSADRMGYAIFGTCFAIRVFGRTLTYASDGCKKYGFGLAPQGQEEPLPLAIP